MDLMSERVYPNWARTTLTTMLPLFQLREGFEGYKDATNGYDCSGFVRRGPNQIKQNKSQSYLPSVMVEALSTGTQSQALA